MAQKYPSKTKPMKRPDRKDPAMLKYIRTDTPISLIDYHFVVPHPRGVLPSRVVGWCREHCVYGWLIQMPRMGQPTFKNTVILFESEDEMSCFRDQFAFDDCYNKRPHEDDWMDGLGDDL